MRGLREPRPRATDAAGWAQDALASQGVYLLGSPVIGTREFVAAKLDDTLRDTRALIEKARSTLLPPSGPHYPEEYLALCRNILPGRFQHHLCAVTHPVLAEKAAEFDAILLDAPTVVIGHLDSAHLNARAVFQLPPAWGGRGYMSNVQMQHAHLQGAWAMTHTKISRRIRAVRDRAPLVSAAPVDSDMFNWEEREPVFVEAAGLGGEAITDLGLPLRNLFGLGLRSAVQRARAATVTAWEATHDVFAGNERPFAHLRRLLPRALVPLDRIGRT